MSDNKTKNNTSEDNRINKKRDNPLKKIREFYEKNKLKVLYTELVTASVILIIALIITNVNIKEDDKQDKHIEETNVISEEPETTGQPLEDKPVYDFTGSDKKTKYMTLAVSYFTNIFADFSENEISKVCISIKNLDFSLIQKNNELVEKLDNFIVYDTNYTAPDGEKVFFIGFDLYFFGNTTPVPMFEPMIVKKSNGQTKVFVPGEDKTIGYYTFDLKETDGYQEMLTIINEQKAILFENDSELKDMYNKFITIQSNP